MKTKPHKAGRWTKAFLAGEFVPTPATQRQDRPVRMKGGMPDVPTLVAFDLHARAEAGKEKYGERLTPFNGRDALVDAYQEALDIVQYLRQALYERDGK